MQTAALQTGDRSAESRRFIGSVLLISGGTVAAQALAAAAAPVITRLFSPADFGILGVYMALLGLFSTTVTLRYEWAIPLADSEIEAANLFALSLGIAILNSGLLLLLILVLRRWLSSWEKTAAFTEYAMWLPAGVVATSVYQALSAWAVRRRDYRALAATKITQTAGMIGFQIGSALLQVGTAGLLIGQIIGQAGGSGTLARRTVLAERGWLRTIRIRELLNAARKFKRFPKFSAGAVLLNSCSEALPILCVMAMFGPVVTGCYILVQRLIFVPGNALVSSVSQVFFGEICHFQRQCRPDLIRGSFIRRFWQLLLLGVVGSAVGAIIAPYAVPFLFGEKWRDAGVSVQIFAPVFAMWLPASSLSGVLTALQRQDLHLKREVVRIALVTLGLVVAYASAAGWVHTFMIISLAFTMDMIFYAALSWRSLADVDALFSPAGTIPLAGQPQL